MVGSVPSAFVFRSHVRLRSVALIVSLLAISCGDGSPVEPSVLGRAYERASVGGVVRRDGAAVAGARVTLGEGGRSTVTDASGAYRFEGVEPGTYRVVALDGGDSAVVCPNADACITARSARHATVEVVVAGEPVVTDIDL